MPCATDFTSHQSSLREISSSSHTGRTSCRLGLSLFGSLSGSSQSTQCTAASSGSILNNAEMRTPRGTAGAVPAHSHFLPGSMERVFLSQTLITELPVFKAQRRGPAALLGERFNHAHHVIHATRNIHHLTGHSHPPWEILVFHSSNSQAPS